MGEKIVINREILTEGVRICKLGSGLIFYSAGGTILGKADHTDIASFAEALQVHNRSEGLPADEKVHFIITVPDQVIQITRD